MARQQQIKSEKAKEFTFGIEIECFIKRRNNLPIGSHRNPLEIGNGFPEGWNIKTDGSLHTTLPNHRAVEIVSPILKGDDGLAQVKRVVKELESLDAQVNRTCGFHVHVGAKSVAGELADGVAGWVSNLINLVGQHETALYAATGSRFRATACRYTRSIKSQYSDDKRKELKKKKWDVLVREITGMDRYRTLNVNNMLNSRMTVEFRAFAGTVNYAKMLGYIQMAMGLCEKALGPAVTFNAPLTRTYRGGDGQKALERLFYLLGWNLGRKDVGKPECSTLGWIHNLSELKTVKTELRRLAKKFDSKTEN
jgi:hypothetical protein